MVRFARMRRRATKLPGLSALALLAVLMAGSLAGCSSGGGGSTLDATSATTTTEVRTTSSATGGATVRPLALIRVFVECLANEGVDIPRPGGGLGSRLEALRSLAPTPEIRAAVRACFPALAQSFTDAGLRPPTQGDLVAETTTTTPPSTTQPPTTVPETTTTASTEPVPSDGAPAFEGDYADPFLLNVDGDRYIYATNTLGQNVPAARLAGTNREPQRVEALPRLPTWTEPGSVWAPSVAEVRGGFALYYTTRDRASGRQCISVATADDPLGPFVDDSSEALICQVDEGGSIDASPYADGDHQYVVWKSDGNCCGIPTTISAQETSPDGTRLVGAPDALLGVDQGWEGDLVEGPSLVKVDGELRLFYSANRWDTADYAVGYAVCESVSGPCSKPEDHPWLFTYDNAAGPGGEEFSVGPDGMQVVYHGWSPDAVGYSNGGVRRLYVEDVDLADEPPLLGFTP